jgi:hypothetical protein
MKTIIIIFALIATASAQVLLVSPQRDRQPTLAPHDCYCGQSCKCDPCECNVAKAKPVVSVKKAYNPTEASVIVRNANGKQAFQCSGTAIDTKTVATCWHILRERDFLNITVDGKPARVLRFDPASDVALLETEHELKSVPVAREPLKAGDECHAYGYEFDKKGLLYRWRTKISQVNRYRGFPNQSIVGRPQSGRSGGGLFNERGELVGVCSAADGQEGLYCGLDAIRQLVYGTAPKIAPQAIKPKQATPFLQDCPTGTCPLVPNGNKPAANRPIAQPPAVFQGSLCPNGNCTKAPSVQKVLPSERRQVPMSPVRRGFFFRGRR